MKKKIVSTLLCTAMLVTMMAGCGGNSAANTSTNSGNSGSNAADTTGSDATADEAAPATESTASDASASDEGKVLNIYCWNEEFKSRVTDHYPGYTEVDATTGTIGDVTVKWNITPNDDNAYQNNLDATLLKQADAAADDKIDIFLVEADYA
ncbi:MAG TPA: ABC transporter substrate-binding protein, partial [Roseburia sp.]|nr:ABC transporter substrate-binding protein [Roseburia sp.]